MASLLADPQRRRLALAQNGGLVPEHLPVGQGKSAPEVAVCSTASEIRAFGLGSACQTRKLCSPEEPDFTRRMEVNVLLRSRFIAYTENHDLLPCRHKQAYRRRPPSRRMRQGLPCADIEAWFSSHILTCSPHMIRHISHAMPCQMLLERSGISTP
jgi:hypothetical protein